LYVYSIWYRHSVSGRGGRAIPWLRKNCSTQVERELQYTG